MNLFNKVEFMPGASEAELLAKALQHAQELYKLLYRIPGMNDNVFIGFICSGIRLAVMDDGIFSEQERGFVHKFFAELLDDYPRMLDDLIGGAIEELQYKLVKDAFNIGTFAGMELCNLIMCFAYLDGKFEDDVSQRLSEIVKSSANVFPGTPQDFLMGM